MSWGEPPTPPPPPPPPPSPPPPPPPPYGGGYPPPGYGYGYGPPAASRTNGFAIAALVLGIVGVVTVFFVVPSVLALIFGLIARNQIRERGEQGKGMATAGIVLGAIGLALFVLIIVLIAVFGSDTSNDNYYGLARMAVASIG